MKTWTIKEALSSSWTKVKENIWTLLVLMLVVYIANYLLGESPIGFLVSVFTGYLMVGIFLRVSRGQKFKFKDIFLDLAGGKIVQYLVLMIVVTCFVVIGFFILFIPGIVIALMMSLSTFILMDEPNNTSWKGNAFWRAIKHSRELTYGHKWGLFGFFLVVMALNILGALAFGVGLIFTIPVTGIALAHIYNTLKNKPVLAEVVEAGKKEESTTSESTQTNN